MQITTPNENDALAKFLDVDKYVERSDSVGNANEPVKVGGPIDYNERLRIIVKNFRNTILMAPVSKQSAAGRHCENGSNPRKIPDDIVTGIASSSGSGGNSFTDSFARSISNTVFPRSRSNTNADSKGALSRNNSGHGSSGTTPTGPSSLLENGLYTSSRNNGKIRRMNTTDTMTTEDAVSAAGAGAGAMEKSQGRKESSSFLNRDGTPGLSHSNANAVDHVSIAADLIKKQKFLTYMGNTFREYEDHCNLHINNYDRPDPSPARSDQRTLSKAIASPLAPKFVSGSTKSKACFGSDAAVRAILSADLDLDDLEYTLDECADHILEATMSHYNLTMSYSSSTSVSTARGTESSHIVVNEFRNPFPTKHEGDHKAYSRSGSGSKYSYFNKEFKRLSTNDKMPSSGHEGKSGSFKPPSRGATPKVGSLTSISSSIQAETAFFGGQHSPTTSSSSHALAPSTPTR